MTLTLSDGRWLVHTTWPHEDGSRPKHWWLVDNETGSHIRQLDEFEEDFIRAALAYKGRPA